jgi:hypothetical protein
MARARRAISPMRASVAASLSIERRNISQLLKPEWRGCPV